MNRTRNRIIAIRKPDRFSSVHHITHVQLEGPGLLPTILPVEDVIARIDHWGEQFYTLRGGLEANVEVVHRNALLGVHRDNIRTVPDGTRMDNLLSLPEIYSNALSGLGATLAALGSLGKR